ncbi:DNA/RNA non-specific endonuclease [Pseudoalteromonas carrageenovora]
MVEQINAFDAVTGGLDLFVSGLLNSVVDVVAGGAGIVTFAMSGGDVDAAVHTIESVQSNQIGPFTDAGQAVSEKLAPIVQEYYEDNMSALGDRVLEATDSPALATMTHKSVEIAATLAGGKTVLNGAKGAKAGLKAPKASVYKFDDLESFNRAANKPKPNSTYVHGDHSWKTDDKGRVIEASGKVKLQKADGRAGTDGVSTVLIGKEGEIGDIGFHLIGDQFDGPTNRLNVVPGNGKRIDPNLPPNLNQGAYAKFERKVKDVRLDPVNAGKDIEIKIKPKYRKSNQTNRPDQFEVSYRVGGGELESFIFKNQQGG